MAGYHAVWITEREAATVLIVDSVRRVQQNPLKRMVMVCG
jgi:hypothetical protein